MADRVQEAPRTSFARRFGAASQRLSLAAVLLVACSTYDASLLTTYNPATAAGGSSGSGAASAGDGGLSVAGAPGVAGTLDDAGFAGVDGNEAGSDAAAGMASVAGTDGGGAAGSAGGGATGIGGTGGSGGIGGGAAGSSGGLGGAGTSDPIDDFEDADAFILPVHKRNGPWYVFNDNTAGKESPFTIGVVTGANAAPGSLLALHFTASGYTGFGAGVGADFVSHIAKKVAYDVSAYTGFRFYAKIASGSQATLKLLVPTVFSDPDGGKCSGVGLSQCNDHLFCWVRNLKTTWAVYQCDFADLTQQGFGLAQLGGLDPTSVYSMQFSLSTASFPVDIWIDDVSFVVK